MVDGPDVYWHQGEWHMLYFRDGDYWVMLCFGASRNNPDGLDTLHSHNTSQVYNMSNDTYYMFCCAVGAKGRVISLVNNKSLD
jgi:hypothetical protein